MKELYFRGTKFVVELINREKEKFLLVECHEEGYVFQLVCIDGYNAGRIYGLIENQRKSERAIDIIALKKGLIKNVMNYNDDIDIQFEK